MDLGESKDLHRNGFGGPRVMDEAAHIFCRLARQDRFPATLANLGRDTFHQHMPAFNVENLAHVLSFGGGVAADVASKLAAAAFGVQSILLGLAHKLS
jgi:hypothetical protein